jgi:hypothetical protein
MKLWWTLLVSLFYLGSTDACTCVEFSDETLIEKAPVIFKGRVDKILPVIWQEEYQGESGQIPNNSQSGDDAVIIVSESWKGLKGQRVFRVRQFMGNCNVTFEVGKEYLLFCQWYGGCLTTNGCLGTMAFYPNIPILQKLGKGTKPPIAKFEYVMVAIVCLLLTGVGLLLKRKITNHKTTHEK